MVSLFYQSRPIILSLRSKPLEQMRLDVRMTLLKLAARRPIGPSPPENRTDGFRFPLLLYSNCQSFLSPTVSPQLAHCGRRMVNVWGFSDF
jgi:hypothetical protein